VTTSTVATLGERALIERLRARITLPDSVVVGPGDDAAVVKPARGELDVLTVDAQVEGVHFDRRFVPAEAIGHRALAVNLSDLAAMGAQPRAALLSLALPSAFTLDDFDRLLDGFLALADRHGTALIGGNITRTDGPLVVDVTALGSVRPRRILSRQTARPGDSIYVTGSPGIAAIGLRLLRAAAAEGASAPGVNVDAAVWTSAPEQYLHPEPRIRAGQLLGRNRAASSCIDLSDGLADGLRQIALASGVGMAIDASAVPLHADVTRWHQTNGGDPLDTIFAGGDDYELLFTVRPAHRGRLRMVRQQLGALSVTRIGVVTKDPALIVTTSDGARPLPQGYEHYR
jgi:thiamine-monophosphate kinase